MRSLGSSLKRACMGALRTTRYVLNAVVGLPRIIQGTGMVMAFCWCAGVGNFLRYVWMSIAGFVVQLLDNMGADIFH
eukprot:6669801-Pyramimonas_sp.AAC.1